MIAIAVVLVGRFSGCQAAYKKSSRCGGGPLECAPIGKRHLSRFREDQQVPGGRKSFRIGFRFREVPASAVGAARLVRRRWSPTRWLKGFPGSTLGASRESSRDSRPRPLPDRAASWPALTSARAHAGALHSSVASCRPWRCRAGIAHARIAPPPRARRASRLRLRACLASEGHCRPSDAHTRAVAKRRKSPPIRLSPSEGAPRLNDGSRVNTSVATSVSRSWLLTNEVTRWRVSLTTAATASRL